MPRPAHPRDTALRLTLRQLQIFVAVAAAGGTAAAARRIALSQPATSAAVNELEALLEVRLFDRVGGRLVLNEHGRTMLPEARLLLDAAQSIEGRFGRGGRVHAPHLRLAASTTIGNYLIPPLLAAYRRTTRGRASRWRSTTRSTWRARWPTTRWTWDSSRARPPSPASCCSPG